jgi:anti-anti-sigma factor
MRTHGLVDSPRKIGANGHACWSYQDLTGDFRDAAVAFLTEGVELGQALMFVGGPQAEEVVRSIEPMSSMVADGSLQIAPFESVYPGGRRMADSDQWTAYAAATEQAREGGFTGLRVLAEVTSLASAAGAWHEQALWESYADRRMADFSLAALCCFEHDAVPPEGMAAIASAHPVVDRRLDELVPFRLFGRADAVAVAGEVDAFSSASLRHLLRAGDGLEAGQVLDLGDLTFIEHTGLLALHEYAERVRARGVSLTVRGGSPTLHRLADLLRISL